MNSEFDIIIFAGQSNMEGETEGLPKDNNAVIGALEYRFNTNELIPLTHPVGEEVGNELLSGATNGGGCLVPDFCREYVSETNHNVIAVHTARGSTTISKWLKGTERYECMSKKISAAIIKTKELGSINKIYFVWLQGESDAIIGTSKKEYMQMLTELKNSVKGDFNIDKFGIIKVGYFCRIAEWLEYSKNGEGKLRDEEIMAAQESVTLTDDDFVLLTDICKTISMDEEYMNPNVGGHYNNKGMEKIGKTAGAKLAEFSMR